MSEKLDALKQRIESNRMDDTNLMTESGRLETASRLYEQFCFDLLERSDAARCRLVSGIQVAIRDAAASIDNVRETLTQRRNKILKDFEGNAIGDNEAPLARARLAEINESIAMLKELAAP